MELNIGTDKTTHVQRKHKYVTQLVKISFSINKKSRRSKHLTSTKVFIKLIDKLKLGNINTNSTGPNQLIKVDQLL